MILCFNPCDFLSFSFTFLPLRFSLPTLLNLSQDRGVTGLTTGVDLSSLKPDLYGQKPTTKVIEPILELLQEENQKADGPLSGALNLSKVILGGHSAGGTMALQNPASFFPQVIASFSYGAHNAAPSFLGYQPGTFLPLPARVPYLILGGSRDGVIANSAFRYQPKDLSEEEGREWDPVRETFRQGLKREQGDSFLVVLKGANHSVVLHPEDRTVGRGFLDMEPLCRPDDCREALVRLLASFLAHSAACSSPSGSLPSMQALLQELAERVEHSEVK